MKLHISNTVLGTEKIARSVASQRSGDFSFCHPERSGFDKLSHPKLSS
jgi:hypothetical protein